MRSIFLPLAATLLLVGATAHADETPAPAAPAPLPAPPTPAPLPAAPTAAPTPTATPAIGSYRARYVEARESLLAGHFDECRDAFATLAAEAPSESDRLLASEMADICGNLAKKGLAFVHQKDLGESNLSAKATGIRTTDELAILYTNAVLYGVGTGFFVGAAVDAKGPAGFVLPMIGTAGVASALIYAADRGKGMPYGVPQSITTGLYLGFEQGLLWTLWQDANNSYSNRWKENTKAAVIWGSATLGALAGGIVGATSTATPGRASWVGSTGLWTGVVAGFAGLAAHGDGRGDDAAFELTAAIGVAAGAGIGLLTAKAVSPSIARVRFLDLGALAGGLLAGGLYYAAADRSSNATAFSTITALGVLGGLGTAWALTSSMPRDDGPRVKDEAKFSPTIAPTQGGATFGVAGMF